MYAQPRNLRRQLLIWSLPLVLLLFAPTFLYRVYQQSPGCDFPEFHAAGRHILEHGTRADDTILHRYLPSVDVAWVLIAWMPLKIAAPVYYVLSCLSVLGLLSAVGRYLLPDTPADHRWVVLLAAGLCTIIFTIDHLFLGAFHILMLWLMVAGLGRIMQGRSYSGAGLLGVAIWLKILPLIGVGYLLLKRRWREAVVSVGVAVTVDLLLTLLVFGAANGWAAHAKWWHARAVGDLEALLSEPQFVSQQIDRNQSPAAVMRRVLTRSGVHQPGAPDRYISIANLSSKELRITYFAIMAALAAMLVWYWKEPVVTPSRAAAEIAVVIVATLWFSPIVYSYHPTAAIPALAVLLGSGWEKSPMKRTALLVWILCMFLLAIPIARAGGEVLWASLLLGLTVAMKCSSGSGVVRQSNVATVASRS